MFSINVPDSALAAVPKLRTERIVPEIDLAKSSNLFLASVRTCFASSSLVLNPSSASLALSTPPATDVAPLPPTVLARFFDSATIFDKSD
jgi:hypothetical protein